MKPSGPENCFRVPSGARRSPSARPEAKIVEANVHAGDRAYCRVTLPKVSRTFALNIRVLSGPMAESVRVAYLLCRAADTIEDSWPGDSAAIARRFAAFLEALRGDACAAETLAREAAPLAPGREDLSMVAELPRVWRVFMALPEADRVVVTEGVETLASGMCRYASRAAARASEHRELRPYLDDERELRDYCWVVAGCVGVMLSRLFAIDAEGSDRGPEARRLALSPTVGEALQLTNILLDWPVDVRRGRCYVPAEWLTERGLSVADLTGAPRDGSIAIAARLESLARTALASVPDYLDTIATRHTRYRLFCLWPALWAKASLHHARRDPDFPWGARRPKLPRHRLVTTALRSLIAVRDPRRLRRLYGSVG